MFLSNGQIVESIDAGKKRLSKAINEAVSRGFTGRVSYKNMENATYASVELLNGEIVLCRGIDRDIVHEGDECLDRFSNYAYVSEGFVEVMKIELEHVKMDMYIYPTAVVDRSKVQAFLKNIEQPAEVPRVEEPRVVKPTTPPPMPKVAAEVKPELKPVPKPALAVETTAAAPTITPVSAPTTAEECIDPVLLYKIIKTGILEREAALMKFSDVVDTIRKIVEAKKVSKVYISALSNSHSVKMLFDADTNNLYVELEEEGKALCGSKAVEKISNKELRSARIWSLT